MKGSSLESLPPLSKQLSTVHDGIIGLMCVWEYRSPSKSVPPHYQCKLCLVSCTQSAMIAHIKSWKHSFKYMKKFHPNKTNWQVEEVTKNSALKNKVKEAALEVEKIEGQGKPRVVLKEPVIVYFILTATALPRTKRKTRQGKGPRPPHFGKFEKPRGQRYSNILFTRAILDRDIFGADNGREDYRSGLVEEDQGRPYYDDYRDIEIDREMDGQLDKPGLLEEPQSQNTRSTLLSYLDTFRIENENDAQLVLKVTQKLTDALMDYRLRKKLSKTFCSSMNSTDLMNYSSSSMFSNDRYSSSLSGT
uniref:Si:ch211-197h24.6 n=1 Tax=Cynoglossus semilaevis TaxID=244447 RepID=A0A3P8UNL5_CYNSE